MQVNEGLSLVQCKDGCFCVCKVKIVPSLFETRWVPASFPAILLTVLGNIVLETWGKKFKRRIFESKFYLHSRHYKYTHVSFFKMKLLNLWPSEKNAPAESSLESSKF